MPRPHSGQRLHNVRQRRCKLCPRAARTSVIHMFTCSPAAGRSNTGTLVHRSSRCCERMHVQHNDAPAVHGLYRRICHGVEHETTAVRISLARPHGALGHALLHETAVLAGPMPWQCIHLLCSVVQGEVTGVAYDAINNVVASSSKDKTARIWQPALCASCVCLQRCTCCTNGSLTAQC